MNVSMHLCVHFAWCALRMYFVVHILVGDCGNINIIDLEVSGKCNTLPCIKPPLILEKRGSVNV